MYRYSTKTANKTDRVQAAKMKKKKQEGYKYANLKPPKSSWYSKPLAPTVIIPTTQYPCCQNTSNNQLKMSMPSTKQENNTPAPALPSSIGKVPPSIPSPQRASPVYKAPVRSRKGKNEKNEKPKKGNKSLKVMISEQQHCRESKNGRWKSPK
jgi:hypothetical protein